MNFVRIISYVLTTIMFVNNVSANGLHRHADKTFVFAGAVLVNEKRASAIFGDKIVSPHNQVVIGKAVVGGAGNLIKDLDKNKKLWFMPTPNAMNQDEKNKQHGTAIHAGERFCYKKFAGYVLVNGSLRFAVDKCSLNPEKLIDQKCDEYLSENAAWLAKPVANALVDLAYDYVTVQLVLGVIDDINKSE